MTITANQDIDALFNSDKPEFKYIILGVKQNSQACYHLEVLRVNPTQKTALVKALNGDFTGVYNHKAKSLYVNSTTKTITGIDVLLATNFQAKSRELIDVANYALKNQKHHVETIISNMQHGDPELFKAFAGEIFQSMKANKMNNEKQSIVEWFDPLNKDHLKLYVEFSNTGSWPDCHQNLMFNAQWHSQLHEKVAKTLAQHVLSKPDIITELLENIDNLNIQPDNLMK